MKSFYEYVKLVEVQFMEMQTSYADLNWLPPAIEAFKKAIPGTEGQPDGKGGVIDPSVKHSIADADAFLYRAKNGTLEHDPWFLASLRDSFKSLKHLIPQEVADMEKALAFILQQNAAAQQPGQAQAQPGQAQPGQAQVQPGQAQASAGQAQQQ